MQRPMLQPQRVNGIRTASAPHPHRAALHCDGRDCAEMRSTDRASERTQRGSNAARLAHVACFMTPAARLHVACRMFHVACCTSARRMSHASCRLLHVCTSHVACFMSPAARLPHLAFRTVPRVPHGCAAARERDRPRGCCVLPWLQIALPLRRCMLHAACRVALLIDGTSAAAAVSRATWHVVRRVPPGTSYAARKRGAMQCCVPPGITVDAC
jgi:hypothetical protein